MIATHAQWNSDLEIGYGLQSDGPGFLRSPVDGHRISIDTAGDHGLYPLVVTEPSLSDTQTKDAEVWSFDGSTISLTWSVRDKTQDELDEEAASGVLDRQLYFVLKWLYDEGVITQANVDNAPQALRDAWAARSRLES